MLRLFLMILCLTVLLPVPAQSKHEIRAVWLTTAYGLDWPSTRATTPAGVQRQQAELCSLLDELQAAHFNTILFQVRIRGDVTYPSSIEPFNEVFTGKEGIAPAYNPLAFAINECHKRGMELHAWLVTIPLGTDSHLKRQGKLSARQRIPSLCRFYQQEWYLDPGNPETKNYLMKLVNEVVTNYDVDGIHLDYIRYPDRPAGFPDSETFRKYGKGKALATWRRDNITAIVRHIYHGTKALKPWVKVSSSPIGKFRDTSRYPSGGWNAYHTVYQDAQGWLREGIQDMLFPMMYFRDNGFYPFALDWQEKCSGRFIIPGLGIYFLHPSEKNWPLEDIERQINFTRAQRLAGQAYFRTRFVTNNTKRLADELVCNYYAYPALVPPMTWLDKIPPSAPTRLEKEKNEYGTVLRWTSSTDNDKVSEPYYTIYASDSYPVDTRNARNITAIRVIGNQYVYIPSFPDQAKRYFAVTAVDRYGNESLPAQEVHTAMFSLVQQQNRLILPDENRDAYIIITDIGGRCVFSSPYTPFVDIGKLERGYYRCLITGKAGQIYRTEGFIKE